MVKEEDRIKGRDGWVTHVSQTPIFSLTTSSKVLAFVRIPVNIVLSTKLT